MTTSEAARLDRIREELPAVQAKAYLNTGSYGPLPRSTVEAMTAYQQRELNGGRSFLLARETRLSAVEELARYFACRPENIALTRHTTDGMNIGILGINWRPGDELVISNMEHPGGQAPAYNVARRYGVTVRLARLGDGGGDVVGAIERVISPRTRAVVISHVTWNTGAVLPLAEIAELAHRHFALVIVDGAQSAGSIPVRFDELGVDVYAVPGQKWLCGPESTGAVYVADEALDRIQPTFVGGSSAALGGWEHLGGYFLPRPGAGRFEVGGTNQAAVHGQATSLRWLSDEVGHDWALERISRLGQYAWQRLAAIDGVSMITPRERMAGLVCFNLDGFAPPDLVARLAERQIEIRYIGAPLSARVSTGFYNTEADIDRLAEAIDEIRRDGQAGSRD